MNQIVPKIHTTDSVDVDYTYDPKSATPPPPSVAEAIGQIAATVDLNAMRDVIFEYSRNRYGELKIRFRCYK
jgi:hypothetical protein